MTQLTLLPAVIEQRLTNWWEFGDQEYPCILASTMNARPRELPDTDDLHRFWTDVGFVVRRAMARIDATEWLGLALPFHYVDQGSSAMAGALGCRMEYIDKETVWAYPACNSVRDVLDVELGAGQAACSRIWDITRRSVALAKDHHFVAPFALEGITDLMAALYGLEDFLVDLLMKPREVTEAMSHLCDLWLQAFADIEELIAGCGNPGGIGWAGIWAPGTTFPLQEDVAYNISPEMFGRFCVPLLRRQVAAMEYPFFHLDGVGMIAHLDHLLAIDEIKAIQWQPGAGKERLDQWYDLIGRILASGKSVQVYATCAEVAPLVKAVGARGLMAIITDHDEDAIGRLLDRFPQDRE